MARVVWSAETHNSMQTKVQDLTTLALCMLEDFMIYDSSNNKHVSVIC